MTDSSPSKQIQPPPKGFWPIMRKLGPGLIISGSIVGSGELIATTTLGAEVGFVALWLIILSCGIKVVFQEELGRYVVSTGDTALQGLNRVPGPKWRVSWVVWCWWIMTIGVIIQGSGIVGGVGQTLHLFLPQINGTAWAMVAAITVMVLLFRGRYGTVEKICVGMVVSFTFVTIACAVLLGWTPYAPTAEDFLSGLRLSLPAGGIAVAFAAFGLTGVGAAELIMYPYWVLEKGYARFVGPRIEGSAWDARARGWIRVMQADVLMAMVVYTTATVAFYILGAAILGEMGTIPAGYEMISPLSNM
ncbi:MAG: Nramp family divalent metal transporter [Bacteroidetes bacterium]|nr:Nramp family divalent metal transporter [Bacteroidota bacterium]